MFKEHYFQDKFAIKKNVVLKHIKRLDFADHLTQYFFVKIIKNLKLFDSWIDHKDNN